MTTQTPQYERKVTGAERFFSHSPFSTVTMVARITGQVSAEMLQQAVMKLQQQHVLLQVRIKYDQHEEPWFTTEGVQEIPIEVVPRHSKDDWIKIHAEASKIPYEFEARPAIRFILVQSPEISELIILCHHIICDGLSLAYLARDILVYLGDFTIYPEPLAITPVTVDTLPSEVVPSGLVKFFINRINQKWAAEIVHFDQDDYEALTEAYWDSYQHEIVSIELSAEETAKLVARCRAEQVTVNSALTAAFSGALGLETGGAPHRPKTAIAVSVRERVTNPPGEGLGFYAQGFELHQKFNSKRGFWDNARVYHQKIKANAANKKVFNNLPNFLLMDSNIYEALNFKKLGALVSPQSPQYQKLFEFSQRDDVVVKLLQRAKMASLESKMLGSAITNLGRMDFPTNYGALELDRLIMQPGGAFPLVHVDMVIGAVTAAGKLSLVIEYTQAAVDSATIEKIKSKALNFLLEE